MTKATRMSQTSAHAALPPKAGALNEPLSQMLYAARWLGMLLVLGVHASAAFINFNALTPETTPLFIAAWRFTVNYAYGRQAVIGFFCHVRLSSRRAGSGAV